MIILEDSRQQATKHKLKHEYFKQHGVHINRSALQCGDYQLPSDGSVAVDTKKDIQELIGDIQFKAMSKNQIHMRIRDIAIQYCITENDFLENIYHLITDDDSDRFVEKELSDYCFQKDIPEGALKEFQNLYVKRHGFFHRGLIRAKNYGVQLYVLVENKDGVTDLSSLSNWENPRRKIMVNGPEQIGFYKNGKPKYRKVQKFPNCMMGEQLAKACWTMEEKYGVKFVFCRPEESAEMILKLLGVG